MPITGEGLISTILILTTQVILSYRRNKRDNKDPFFRLVFSVIWERTLKDIPGFADPEYCFDSSSLQYLEDPSKDPIADLKGGRRAG